MTGSGRGKPARRERRSPVPRVLSSSNLLVTLIPVGVLAACGSVAITKRRCLRDRVAGHRLGTCLRGRLEPWSGYRRRCRVRRQRGDVDHGGPERLHGRRQRRLQLRYPIAPEGRVGDRVLRVHRHFQRHGSTSSEAPRTSSDNTVSGVNCKPPQTMTPTAGTVDVVAGEAIGRTSGGRSGSFPRSARSSTKATPPRQGRCSRSRRAGVNHFCVRGHRLLDTRLGSATCDLGTLTPSTVDSRQLECTWGPSSR